MDYAPQLMARLTLAGQAMGDLSGFHNAMFIFHWAFSFKADLLVTPELCPLRPSCNLSALRVLGGSRFRRRAASVAAPFCRGQRSAQIEPLESIVCSGAGRCVGECGCDFKRGLFVCF